MQIRRPIIAANWKMNKDKDEALEFVFNVYDKVPDKEKVESVIFPTAVFLNLLAKREGENLRIGAQNMHYEDEGAYTGEISPLHIKTSGAEYVLLGHSERRNYYNEVDDACNLKLHAALKHSITPILCIGESTEIKDEGNTKDFIINQVTDSLKGIPLEGVTEFIIAYEPIWAIGTGKTATPKLANSVAKAIRATLTKLYNEQVSQNVRILYGGSVDINNVESYLKQDQIDGVLVGRATLDPQVFLEFTRIAEKVFDLKKVKSAK